MKQTLILCAVIVLLSGCGVADGATTDAEQAQVATLAQPTVLLGTARGSAPSLAQAARPAPTEDVMIQGGSNAQPIGPAGMQALVKQDLAAYLQVPLDAIGLQSIEERTWPDTGLGCRARTGVREPVPTAGYLIVLTHGNDSYPYHTDLQTRFVRCVASTKPTGPAAR